MASPRPGSEEDELACFNIDFSVEAQNADIISNAFVVNKRHWSEIHIDVVSDQRFRLLGFALQIAGQCSEIVGYLVGCHADQRRANANNRSACLEGVAYLLALLMPPQATTGLSVNPAISRTHSSALGRISLPDTPPLPLVRTGCPWLS